MALPNTLNNILVSINEWGIENNINAAFEKLYENFEFLDKQTFVLQDPLNSDSVINFIKPLNQNIFWSLNSIKIHKNELHQYWVYNKSFKKLIDNHLILSTTLFGKYTDEQKSQIKTLSPGEKSSIKIEIDENYFIGSNEILSRAVINRCLTFIYDIQVKIAILLGIIESNNLLIWNNFILVYNNQMLTWTNSN